MSADTVTLTPDEWGTVLDRLKRAGPPGPRIAEKIREQLHWTTRERADDRSDCCRCNGGPLACEHCETPAERAERERAV